MYGYPLAFTKSRKAVYDAKIIFFGSNVPLYEFVAVVVS